jgi:acetyl-CoA C-acetyltransferase
VPLLFSDAMVLWLANFYSAKTIGQKAAALARFRPAYLSPVIGIMKGLTDPNVGLLMGQTAENLAHRFDITRLAMDEYAARSHARAIRAQEAGWFLGGKADGLAPEIVPVYDARGTAYKDDDGVRKDSTVENLAKLKPFFDRKYGNVTAGNSSQVTDGAAWLLLATEEAVKRHGLAPIGRIVDSQWAGLDPSQMGLGPVHAATSILQRHGLGLNDLDAWEINEAFAAQVLACIAAWRSDEYCRNELGLDRAMGELDLERLNVDGGAIAIGHPVGASGARIVLHLLHVLKRNKGKRGMASICIGGGQGGAMLIEAL